MAVPDFYLTDAQLRARRVAQSTALCCTLAALGGLVLMTLLQMEPRMQADDAAFKAITSNPPLDPEQPARWADWEAKHAAAKAAWRALAISGGVVLVLLALIFLFTFAYADEEIWKNRLITVLSPLLPLAVLIGALLI
jgi:hypothetical protein